MTWVWKTTQTDHVRFHLINCMIANFITLLNGFQLITAVGRASKGGVRRSKYQYTENQYHFRRHWRYATINDRFENQTVKCTGISIVIIVFKLIISKMWLREARANLAKIWISLDWLAYIHKNSELYYSNLQYQTEPIMEYHCLCNNN